MKSGGIGKAGRQLEALWTSGTLAGLTDTELLARFADGRGAAAEAAFRELVDRHGPMVLGVCRQILRRPDDAEDAFQATFLVLVRKARTVRVGDSLAPWLYGVAYRPGIEGQVRDVEAAPEEAFMLDLRPLLQEELGRLPDKYRTPIVLCHLEGKTHAEAARLLRCPVGTVSGRLSRGRRLLRTRLERRGLAVPSALLSAPWLAGTPAVPTAAMVASTLDAAMRFAASQTVSTTVLTLTRGVLRSMLLNKLKTISLAVIVLGAVTGGVGAHLVSGPSKAPARQGASAPLSTPETGAAPAPVADPAPQTQPQPPTDSRSSGADSRLADCSGTCPATGSDGAPNDCPISMAAHGLARMFTHIHDSLVSSR